MYLAGTGGSGVREWYVARTKPRQERQASAVLEQRGIESYLPRFAPRHRRDRSGEPELLFPSYVFVKLDLATDWRTARSAPGVSYLLGGQDSPTPLPDEIVEGIRLRIAKHQEERRLPVFRCGDRVVIVRGPLAGLEAVFERDLTPAGRSQVLVEFVSRLVIAKVEASDLQRVV